MIMQKGDQLQIKNTIKKLEFLTVFRLDSHQEHQVLPYQARIPDQDHEEVLQHRIQIDKFKIEIFSKLT